MYCVQIHNIFLHFDYLLFSTVIFYCLACLTILHMKFCLTLFVCADCMA